MKLLVVIFVALGLAAPATGCAAKGPIPAATKPRRPKSKATKKPAPKQVDCAVAVIEQSPPSVPYKARVIVESNNLSRSGIKLLSDSYKSGLDPALMEQMAIDGVDNLLTALKADPYNVDATYYLAAAYARISRPQCAINLLQRLALLRQLTSHHPLVERRVDQLLGRNRHSLDVSFDRMRAKKPFRDVVEKLIAPL